MEFNSKVILETKRLIIRFVDMKDKTDLFNNIFHDHDVLKYFLADYIENEVDYHLEKQLEYYLTNQKYFMSLELKDTHEVIGLILECDTPSRYFRNVEIGYAIGKKYWNQGYTTEALKCFIEFEMTLPNVHKIICSHIDENLASGKVMQKCGMIYEGKFKDEIYYHDKYYDLCYYYLINKNL